MIKFNMKYYKQSVFVQKAESLGFGFFIWFVIVADIAIDILGAIGWYYLLYLGIFEIKSVWMSLLIVFSALEIIPFVNWIVRIVVYWTGLYALIFHTPEWVINWFG